MKQLRISRRALITCSLSLVLVYGLTERIPSALPKPSGKPNMVNKKGKSNPPYPLDLRKEVCEALANGMGVCEAVRQFGVSQSTAFKWKVLGELPKNAGRPTKKNPIQKANSNPPLENLKLYKALLDELPLDNEMEARNIAANYGVATAINYCRVILSLPIPPVKESQPRTYKLIIEHDEDDL